VYNRFRALSEEEQDQWPTFWDEVNDAAKTILGLSQPSKNDWLTSETLDIIDQKRAARLSGNMSVYKALYAKSKESNLHDKQQWANNIASEAEKTTMWSAEGRVLQLSPSP